MTGSTPYGRTVQRDLRLAPYLACVAAMVAIVLAFYVPLYPALIAAAIALGALMSAIRWIGERRKVNLVWLGTALAVLGWSYVSDVVLPAGMSITLRLLTAAQFIGVWSLVTEVLYIAFHSRFNKDASDRAA
jgi:hypothetical protein